MRDRSCPTTAVSATSFQPPGPHSWGVEKRRIGGHPQTLGRDESLHSLGAAGIHVGPRRATLRRGRGIRHHHHIGWAVPTTAVSATSFQPPGPHVGGRIGNWGTPPNPRQRGFAPLHTPNPVIASHSPHSAGRRRGNLSFLCLFPTTLGLLRRSAPRNDKQPMRNPPSLSRQPFGRHSCADPCRGEFETRPHVTFSNARQSPTAFSYLFRTGDPARDGAGRGHRRIGQIHL
jgi:hypothetical protein